MTQTKTLIQIQEEYIETVNAGIARWSHSKRHYVGDFGGHANRIIHGARKQAQRELEKLNCFTSDEIRQALKDAWDVAELQRNAQDEGGEN